MIPVGYMSKKVVARPEWLKANGVDDVYSVSGCISERFADYVKYGRHNGYWFFNSSDEIEKLCRVEKINMSGNTLFYYEVFEEQFDADTSQWAPFKPEASFPTHVQPPANAELVGYDVATFLVGLRPECSPLSCNSLAEDITTNRHCLLSTLEAAKDALEAGKFDNSEPGPFRIFAVYKVEE